MQFVFENHILDTERRELLRGGVPIALQPQVFDVLVHLIANRDRVVSKDDLIELVWGGRIVSDSALTSRINAARAAVEDSGKAQKFIRTMPRKGFRFVAEVAEQPAGIQPGVTEQQRVDVPQRPLSIPDRPAIAVLAFQNMSDDPEQEYFCDGISEDILTALSKLRWFFVIARNSSFTYKGRAVPLKQIAEELGVRYVLEGSVRKKGEQVRITAQLSDATTGSQVWAAQYDRELIDVFAVQDEITNAIVIAIEPRIYAAESFRVRHKPPNSMDAWDLVIRALSRYWRVTREDHEAARVLLRQAIDIDPDYGQALSVLATSYMFDVHQGWVELAKVAQIAERAALKAVQIDDSDAWAHTALGSVYFSTRRRDDAVSEFELALRLNPNFCLAQGYYALVLTYCGRTQESYEAALRAIRQSPRDPSLGIYYGVASYARFVERDYPESIALARIAVRQHGDFAAAYRMLTVAAAMAGDAGLASSALQELRRTQPSISLDWIAKELPWTSDEARDHYLEGFRRAGLR
jgi:TolB-like protein/cytochrome c-type biogenesis protein CcmH/NrfG